MSTVVRELQLYSTPGMEELYLKIVFVYHHQPSTRTRISIVERPAELAIDLWKLDSLVDGVVGEADEASGFLFFYYWSYVIDIGKHHEPWQLRRAAS